MSDERAYRERPGCNWIATLFIGTLTTLSYCKSLPQSIRVETYQNNEVADLRTEEAKRAIVPSAIIVYDKDIHLPLIGNPTGKREYRFSSVADAEKLYERLKHADKLNEDMIKKTHKQIDTNMDGIVQMDEMNAADLTRLMEE